MSAWKVIFIAFGLSVSFVYFPVVTLIAGLIILTIYNGQEVKSFVGQSVGFVPTLVIGFAVAVGVQAILTIAFGASFGSLAQAGGLWGVLKNPNVIGTLVIKEVLALVIVFCTTYLIMSSPTPQRWVFKLAIGLSLIAIMFQCWNVNSSSQARRSMRLELLREEIAANFDSQIKRVGLVLNRDTVFNENVAQMPTYYYVIQGAYLYSKEGSGVKRGEEIVGGSKWFHLVDGETIIDPVTGVIYEPVASCEDETIVGWLRADKISKLPTAPKKLALNIFAPESDNENPELEKPVISKPPVNQATEVAELEPLQVITEKSTNQITAKSGGNWVSSLVVPDLGDRVELGRFSTPEDIGRLEAKIGEGVISNISPKQSGDGSWYAVLDFSTGGSNPARRPIELKLKNGLPLQVVVRKV